MIDLNKTMDKFFLNLLSILLLCSFCLLDKIVLASSEIPLPGQINIDLTPLRGEIWYGEASWYGPRFHGKKTSNGEKFDKRDLTAAHKTLPFNTKVLVTNLKNNKSIIVRINDRGPFIDNRIIDLSEKAANHLDLRKQGIAYIKLQVLNPLLINQNLQ